MPWPAVDAGLGGRLRRAGVRAFDVSDHAGSWAVADVLAGPLIFVGHCGRVCAW